MSTTFDVRVPSIYDGTEEEIIEIAFRGNGTGVRWTHPLGPLLPEDHVVEAMDNSPQGIYTIGDIRKAIENEEH